MLHVNDCADVALNLVAAARRQGLEWRRLAPHQVRPPQGSHRSAWLPRVARTIVGVRRSDVLHVHYATSVPLIQRPGVPSRPYFLHLHGTDIRDQWGDPRWTSLIQDAIDGAEHVYYTNLDTAEAATEARPDADYMPAFVDFEKTAARPAPRKGQPPIVRFASRWDSSKNAARMIETAKALGRTVGGAIIEGLDWGADARTAAESGVRLVPTMPGDTYRQWLASADVVVGQATGLLGVSELEALAAGVPVAIPVTDLVEYPDGSRPPVVHGSPEEVAEAVAEVLADHRDQAGRDQIEWVREHHTADAYVPVLEDRYRRAAGAS